MIPGFHCSSLPYHDPVVLIERLAGKGFGAIAIRPTRGSWDHGRSWFDSASSEIAAAASEHDVAIVIDLDAPFYDSPDRFEADSLASTDAEERNLAQIRIEDWIEKTSGMRPATITFSTGKTSSSGDANEENLEELSRRLQRLTKIANDASVGLAIRPHAGHAIATVAHFERFEQWIEGWSDHGKSLGLAADVGEMLLGGEFPIGARLARLKHRLACVYLCEPDIERGGDLRFGQGDIDLNRVWNVVTESGVTVPGIFRACGHGQKGLQLADQAMAITNS